jgi:CheY-like chemotaxis protein
VASPTGPRLILLADDNETLRTLAAAYLRQGGFRVLLACDGQEAVDLFQREHPRIDLVILDQMMPNLTGRDALQRIRQISPAARVLLATGSAGTTPVTPAKVNEGVWGVIAKPYRERDLLQAVHQALAQ